MTAVLAPAASRPAPAIREHLKAAARLLRLELRRNAMPWMLPVVAGLFWFTTYRKAMAMPPLWNLRAATTQSGALLAFACPVTGVAAWMGSRETRRRTTDLVTIAARPRWARQLATWAATTCWAMIGYLGCVAALYGLTAYQATGGGPLWWPVAVTAASLPALSALGFAAGTLIPSRFTPPVAALAAFFALGLSTQLIHGSQSPWQITPIVTGAWDVGPDPSPGTFYPYLPDLAIAQVMFLTGLTAAVLGAVALPAGPGSRWLRRPAAVITAAGLLAAGTAVALAGTGKLDAHGMIAIPALHDAANDRPLRYTPACSHTAIPICLNPAYISYLPTTVTALTPVINEIAGLPGAPVRISQAAATYQQVAGNSFMISLAVPLISGTPPVFHLLLPIQLPEPTLTTSELVSQLRSSAGLALVASVIGDGPSATQAQQAVAAGLRMAAGLPPPPPDMRPDIRPDGRRAVRRAVRGPDATSALPALVQAAARRFAALPAPARHAWLVRHLAALRAGQITLAQLP
jgi:hypothetical protein